MPRGELTEPAGNGRPVRQDGLCSLCSLRWAGRCAELANLRFAIQHGDLAALEFQCVPLRPLAQCLLVHLSFPATAIRRSTWNDLQLWNPLLPRMLADICCGCMTSAAHLVQYVGCYSRTRFIRMMPSDSVRHASCRNLSCLTLCCSVAAQYACAHALLAPAGKAADIRNLFADCQCTRR